MNRIIPQLLRPPQAPPSSFRRGALFCNVGYCYEGTRRRRWGRGGGTAAGQGWSWGSCTTGARGAEPGLASGCVCLRLGLPALPGKPAEIAELGPKGLDLCAPYSDVAAEWLSDIFLENAKKKVNSRADPCLSYNANVI